MPEKWTGDLIGRMHNARVTRQDIATELGVSKAYVCMLLNGQRTSPTAKKRFTALCAHLNIVVVESRHKNTLGFVKNVKAKKVNRKSLTDNIDNAIMNSSVEKANKNPSSQVKPSAALTNCSDKQIVTQHS